MNKLQIWEKFLAGEVGDLQLSPKEESLLDDLTKDLYMFFYNLFLEDDRSRDWSDQKIEENMHKIRPEIREIILEYRHSNYSEILKLGSLSRQKIFESFKPHE